MTDMTDDWMDPPKGQACYTYTPPEYPRFLIQRKRRLDYAPFERWDLWESFESRGDRDTALTKLKEKHPAWQLRAQDELQPPRAYL